MRSWTIRKKATLPDAPVDTPSASIVGPNTEAVHVYEAEAVGGLVGALEAMAALYEGENVTAGASEADDAVLLARSALAAFRQGEGK